MKISKYDKMRVKIGRYKISNLNFTIRLTRNKRVCRYLLRRIDVKMNIIIVMIAIIGLQLY